MRVIGLSAKLGCGKTTVANMILESTPGAARLAFADNLKIEAANTYKFPLELCYSEVGKQTLVFLGQEGMENLGAHTMSIRAVLQKHGTEFRRAQDPLYWDNKMREALRLHEHNGTPLVVVDDVRFESECALIREFDGALYRLQPYPGWKPGKNADHISETALDDYDRFDMVFYPEKGMEQLKAVAQYIYDAL